VSASRDQSGSALAADRLRSNPKSEHALAALGETPSMIAEPLKSAAFAVANINLALGLTVYC
jgi:hypothetical protein